MILLRSHHKIKNFNFCLFLNKKQPPKQYNKLIIHNHIYTI